MSTSPPSKNSGTTLVKGALFLESQPNHFMTITPSEQTYVARIGDLELACSDDVIIIHEVAHLILDPVVYFPESTVKLTHLKSNEHSTNCPIKGQTTYFDLKYDVLELENIAWTYEDPIALASKIRSYIAFDTAQVRVISRHPADQLV